jgi:predicted nucleotidyltransferase
MEKLLTELVERMRLSLGDNLVSVTLYGSAAVGDHKGPFSDLNVFCVVSRLEVQDLAAAEGAIRWWRDKGHPSPLLMTEKEMHASTDCFPIEFHDMEERRKVLYGTDAVAGIHVDDAFYRARVEYELRAKLLRLRQKAAGVLSDRDLLIRLMEDSVSTFCVLGRHALRLKQGHAPWGKRDIIAALETVFGLRGKPFYTCLDLREGKLKPRQVDPVTLFEEYLGEITELTGAVDRLDR